MALYVFLLSGLSLRFIVAGASVGFGAYKGYSISNSNNSNKNFSRINNNVSKPAPKLAVGKKPMAQMQSGGSPFATMKRPVTRIIPAPTPYDTPEARAKAAVRQQQMQLQQQQKQRQQQLQQREEQRQSLVLLSGGSVVASKRGSSNPTAVSTPPSKVAKIVVPAGNCVEIPGAGSGGTNVFNIEDLEFVMDDGNN